MKPAVQEVYRDIGIRHPIIHKIRDGKVWGSLHESLTRVDTVKGAVHNPIWVRSVVGNDSDS